MKATILDAIIFAYVLFVAFVVFYAGPVWTGGDPDLWKHHVYEAGLYFAVFLIAGAVANLSLRKNNILTLGEMLFEPEHKKANRVPTPLYKLFWTYQFAVAFLITFAVGIQQTDFSIIELFSAEGIKGAIRIFSALIDPNWRILPLGIIAIIETIYIAFMATILAIPLAFLLSFFSAKNIMGSNPVMFGIYTLLRTLMNITRSIEPLIWAIIFSVWVGIGPYAGMLALMLHSVASLTKQYSEIIECVNEGPIEGIQATGAGFFQTIWYAIVPQIILPYVSFTIYRWDINVRMATIIGLVGGGGIGTLLMTYQGQASYNEVGTLALLIVIAVWLMDTASAYIREAIK